MWSLPATRTTSSQYENLSQTCLSMSQSTVLITTVNRAFMSSIFAGSGGVKTLPLTYPRKKKSHAVSSGDLIGQAQRAPFPAFLPIHRWGTFSFRLAQTPRCQWSGDPPC